MMRGMWYAFVLCAVLWTSSSEGARILCMFPMPAPSHYFLGHKLLRELAARGHDVTMISAFKNKEPVKNYRDIVLEGMREKMMGMIPKEQQNNLVEIGNKLPVQQAILTSFIGSGATEIALKYDSVQNLLKSNEKFDLVIIEMFHTELLYGLAHRYNCPMLILSTIGSSSWTNHLVGNPAPNSYIPDLFLKFSSRMSFYERLQNAIQNIIVHLYRKFMYFPQLDAQLHEYFPDAPPLDVLMYNKTALILLNSHTSISDARPHVPNMIEVGGFHIDEPKPLPKDLKDFMDNAKNGVILFSMGSNLKSVDLGPDVRSAILKSFAKLKQKVIWKWEDENLPDKPANVKIMKWCPQNDIMAHPNLKLFITHGGLLSTTEAVYHGVPIIGIPIFGDQKMNVAMTKRKGFGIGINYEDLTEESLTAALNEILSDPKYRENARLKAQLLRDQPVRPIDSAVYWTEYVINHKGAEHLRTAAMDLEWYQLYSIDLLVFMIVIDLVIFIVFYYIIKKMLGGKKKHDKKDAKKKKN